MTRSADWGPLDRLHDRAETLAGAWSGRARASTSVGQERAMLRLFGVHGLAGDGRPLAGAAVNRWRASDPNGLGTGIALPFAMALLEYDSTPQELALDVASGAVDLSMEGELLRQADRRAVAEAEASRLIAAAIERIDANRTARRELTDVLGDASEPWIGTNLTRTEVGNALEEVAAVVRAGADLVRVEVPIGRELADRMQAAGFDVPTWEPGPPRPRPDGGAERRDPAPTGSQRGLSRIREALDEHAAERRAYVRLATSAPALGTPEAAVVAAFERIDVVEADPMTEIVAGRIDPDRALADHAFAHRLQARSGAILLIGAGPLVVAPDLARGVPSNPATRAGRALALQLLAAAQARQDGLPRSRVLVGALPSWLGDEAQAAALAAAEIAVRRALLPDHPLAFDEPPGRADGDVWAAIVAATMSLAGRVGCVIRSPGDEARRSIESARAAAIAGSAIAAAMAPGALAGVGLEHARGLVSAALETLDRLADEGWRAVTHERSGNVRGEGFGRETVVERAEAFDALSGALGAV